MNINVWKHHQQLTEIQILPLLEEVRTIALICILLEPNSFMLNSMENCFHLSLAAEKAHSFFSPKRSFFTPNKPGNLEKTCSLSV